MIELALPAGSLETALTAFSHGADAVYFGLKDFSARKGAVNFSLEDLSKIRRYSLENGKKTYITINTLIDDASVSRVTDLLDEIREKRPMAIVLTAHAKIEHYEDPEYPSYDRTTPRLHKAACSLIREWVDAVLFATRRKRVDQTTGKAAPIGAGGGERILRTNGGPACVAKNRFHLPEEIPLSWAEFMAALMSDN